MSIASHIAEHLQSADLSGITCDNFAESHGMTTMVLRHALRYEGTNFKTLLDAERKRRCDELIAKRVPYVGLIQRATGYSGPGSITRAFRRWYGVTLQEYKETI